MHVYTACSSVPALLKRKQTFVILNKRMYDILTEAASLRWKKGADPYFIHYVSWLFCGSSLSKHHPCQISSFEKIIFITPLTKTCSGWVFMLRIICDLCFSFEMYLIWFVFFFYLLCSHQLSNHMPGKQTQGYLHTSNGILVKSLVWWKSAYTC